MNSPFVGLIACLINIAVIPLIMLVAKKRGWFDTVNPRKIHTGNIPRLGGIGIFWSFALTVLLVVAFTGRTSQDLSRYWPIGIAASIVHFVGLIDDFKDLRARYKFAAHLVAALIVVFAGFRFRTIYLPWVGEISLGLVSYPLTLVWIVGVINAINMIDGVDGLSGGISLIGAFTFGLIFIGKGLGTQAIVAIALVGSLAGFLFYNFPPAKIFMGDSGSTFLGFVLATLPMLDTSGGGGFWIWDGITALLLPIYDVFAAMIRRARKGVSLMSPDRWHFHHKLLRLKLETRSILAIAYGTCMCLSAVVISSLFVSDIAHCIAILIAWAALLALFIVLHYVKERSLSLEERRESAEIKARS